MQWIKHNYRRSGFKYETRLLYIALPCGHIYLAHGNVQIRNLITTATPIATKLNRSHGYMNTPVHGYGSLETYRNYIW